ncbi:MAG: phosphatase [Atopobiaceae bacterium]|nr:phosphatase [Atopobiaceae bacterium]
MRLACDPHVHTFFSRHAYSTLEENLRAASARDLELIGITEHYSAMLWPEDDPRNFQYYQNFRSWPREVGGVYLCHGAEADIVDLEGHLFGFDIMVDRHFSGPAFKQPRSLKDIVFKDCDYVIASVHDRTFAKGADTAQLTQAYLGALDDPRVFILGHIGRSGLAFDIDEVLLRARELGKCIEINDHSLAPHRRQETFPRCRAIAERCAELGVQVAVSSDAHISFEVGGFEHALGLLDEVGFPEELVVTRSRAAFLDALSHMGDSTLSDR